MWWLSGGGEPTGRQESNERAGVCGELYTTDQHFCFHVRQGDILSGTAVCPVGVENELKRHDN